MSADSPRHVRTGGPLMVAPQPPSDRSIIDAVSGFINDVTLSSSSSVDPKDVIQWARFETADLNEPMPEGYSDNDVSPLLLILGYGAGVQVWLIPPTGAAQEVLSWRQGTVRVLRILPTPRQGDCFASKRPLIALCDSASPGPTFCGLSFISIRGGEQVKSIKFKNQILDVLANKRFVVVSFSERFAVFDAATLEDRMSVTTCYPCPCPMGGSLPINPLALGEGWLAYADKKLNQAKRSGGGCEGEGVISYTATVLHAAKSLSKGLRGLGESVAHSLAGGRSTSQSPSPPNSDIQQPGVVTILDIEGTEEEDGQDSEETCDPIVAHFIAHSEAIIAMKFDLSGTLLVTADRRGHDFHVFKIHPHPCGPSLAAVHHLYILHRGDTTAKVQDIAVSADSRWAALSSLRGTTHVFALCPYGGAPGVRTHTAPRVVNRLSRFHRSAGLPLPAQPQPNGKGSSHSINDMSEDTWYPNPRLPPYPPPTTLSPLAQLRPTANLPTHTITRTSSGRQRLSSMSEDSNTVPLLARAQFGSPPPTSNTRGPAPVVALYLMAANGSLLHLLLHPKPLSSISKEKVCDESPIELEVSSVAQWPLQRPAAAADLLAPLPPSNPLLQAHTCTRGADMHISEEERWLSQVEIVTHAGPHRRLWMGPQFAFKTYNSTGSSTSLSEVETVEVEASGVARSNPVNMPGVRPIVPVIIDSGSASSLEHSPSDSFRRRSLLAETGRASSVCDVQLREDLAEAMKEDNGSASARASPAPRAERSWAVDPLGCVAVPAAGAPPAPEEPAASSNCDEATFRAVARGPAPLAALGPRAARSLPATTTIPVQSAPSPPPDLLRAAPRASPLPTTVVIPAALSEVPQHFILDADVNEKMNARESVPTERARQNLTESLPKSRPSDDIHPIAESSVNATPTEKSDSDEIASDVSFKDRKSRIRNDRSRDSCESTRPYRLNENRDNQARDKKKSSIEVKNLTKDQKDKTCDISVKIEAVKKVATAISNVEKVINVESVPKLSLLKETASVHSDLQEIIPAEHIAKDAVRVETVAKEFLISKETIPKVPITNEQAMKEVVLEKVPIQEKESLESKIEEDIVTLEFMNPDYQQLLNIPSNKPDDVPTLDNLQTSKESKSKTKKNRKSKKSQDELQTKEEEDTFVEIHAIEDKHQQSSDELVSISAPYEEIESNSYMAKTKKSPTTENNHANKNHEFEFGDVWDYLDTEYTVAISTEAEELLDSVIPEINENIKTKLKDSDVLRTDTLNAIDNAESTLTKDSSKPKKTKTLSPYSDRKSIEKRYEPEVKDVYVIDTTVEEFPVIQITTGKSRKKSPQPEKSSDADSYDLKPFKLWSTISASRGKKKSKDEEKKNSKDEEKKNSKDEDKKDSKLEDYKNSEDEDKNNSKVEKKYYKDEDKEISKREEKNIEESIHAEENNDLKPFKLWSTIAASRGKKKSKDEEKKNSKDEEKKNSKDEDKKDSKLEDYKNSEDEDKNNSKVEKKYYKDEDKEISKREEKNIEESIHAEENNDLKPFKLWSTIAASRGKKKSKDEEKKNSKDEEKKNSKDEDKKDSKLEDYKNSEDEDKNNSKVEKKYYKDEDKEISKREEKNIEESIHAEENKVDICDNMSGNILSEKQSSATGISLQEKLIELCKRTDIMVAECDAPTELNFVDEHHNIADVPQLNQPSDYGLDEFKLEEMQDSLLEGDSIVTSPLCEINIDSILSTIKETTHQAIESSAFNLVDLRKMPMKKEKGFSVVNNDRITSQEVRLDDDKLEDNIVVMEKLSDDDNISSVLSADSDKDDKKSAGASNVTLPSTKQLSKSKKSRKKKK